MGNPHLIAEFHRNNQHIWGLSGQKKSPPYSRVNTVSHAEQEALSISPSQATHFFPPLTVDASEGSWLGPPASEIACLLGSSVVPSR